MSIARVRPDESDPVFEAEGVTDAELEAALAGVGALAYVHDQSPLAQVWTVTHNLGTYPNVTAVDTGGSTVLPDVHYVSADVIELTFAAATSGKAYLS